MVVEGVMLGNLPWNLVLIGVFLSLAMWILGIPVLAVAIGVYLPIHLSAPIMVGGLLRRYMESRNFADAAERTNCVQSGVLYSSGLIAGEGLIGILLAILAVMDLDLDMSKPSIWGMWEALSSLPFLWRPSTQLARRAGNPVPNPVCRVSGCRLQKPIP